MKGLAAIFGAIIILIALIFFGVLSLFLWENLHLFTHTVVVEVVYNPNDAYRLLASLLSLNYNSNPAYKLLSLIEYTQDKDFIAFLDESIRKYIQKEESPICYKLIFDSQVLIDFKKEGYSGDCEDAPFVARVPVFVPYNDARLVKYLILKYRR
jgi:hypothetical protein